MTDLLCVGIDNCERLPHASRARAREGSQLLA
jgi:hypothetical protein